MGIDSLFQFFVLTLEVFFLDLLLSGDNAVVIALACRSLPAGDRRKVMAIGTGFAIALRVLLTLTASFVLRIPVLKLASGLALTVIAVRLTLDEAKSGTEHARAEPQGAHADLMSALGSVVVADLAMSTDNVVALAALAPGNVAVLITGLLLSVPLLMFGSWYVIVLVRRHPGLIPLGGALLGWLAGDIAVSDPLYVDWVQHQSPGLGVVVPILTAAYVLAQSRVIAQTQAGAALLRSGKAVRANTAHRAREVIDALALRADSRETGLDLQTKSVTVHSQSRVGRTKRRWLVGAVAIGGLGAIGWAALGMLDASWMPVPAALIRYDCSAKGLAIQYRMGATRIRLEAGGKTVSGVVRPDNQIDWGNLHEASTTLGFVPPTRVIYADAQRLRMAGGMFEELECSVAEPRTVSAQTVRGHSRSGGSDWIRVRGTWGVG